MAFRRPNEADAPFIDQAKIDAVDDDIVASAFLRYGVSSGLAVTQNSGGADMSVDVAAGIVFIAGLLVTATNPGNFAISAADATHSRFDLVVVDNVGTISVIEGTDSTTVTGVGNTNAVFPTYPSTSVVLAAVYIPASTTAITTASHIQDRRFFIGPGDHGTLNGLADDDHTGYLLASAAGGRATFATNWTDLTDGGATALHTHAGGGYTDEEAQDAVGGILTDSSTIDFTYNDGVPSITADVIQAALDHGSIGGLSDDDHTGYFRLAGRAGGQDGAGGTGSADPLQLRSTTHSTKGAINLDSSVKVDEANNSIWLLNAVLTTDDAFGFTAASGTPRHQFDAGDLLAFIRSSNTWSYTIGGGTIASFGASNTNPIWYYAGHTRVGSTSVPTNTTAGDLTATRLIVPDATILHSAISQLGGPVVIPGSGRLLFSDNTNYVALAPPATLTDTTVIRLPDGLPSGVGEIMKVSAISDPLIDMEWSDILHSDVSTTSMVQTITVWAGAIAPAQTDGCGTPVVIDTGETDIVVSDFIDSVIRYGVFQIAMPDNWDGSTVTARFIWTTSSSTSTHTCRWGLQGRSYADSETLNQAYGSPVFVDDNATGTAYQMLISDATSAITFGGTPAAGEVVAFRVQRDPTHANDDLAATARLIAIKIEFGITALSS